MADHLSCGRFQLDLHRVQIMGILNVTPDSFSDGGQWQHREQALAHVQAMVEAGATVIDIGGESTRPGAPEVPVQQELDRVIPLLETLAPECPVPISVDTSKAEVMSAAAAAGASMINDVFALRQPGALEAVAATDLPVCLMHMQGQPRTMQQAPEYSDVLNDVRDFLAQRIAACEAAGIERRRIVLDPGFGFGKTLEHNLALLRALSGFHDLGLPLLAGISRKSMIGQITGREVNQRVHGSVVAAFFAMQQGAQIIRVHDVAATRDAVRMFEALSR
jgi:dihydropteroate synthase